MKLNFQRQEYGTVNEPGSLRSQYRLAPNVAVMLRRLANGGRRSGVLAVAIETLHALLLGTSEQIEECAETLARLPAFGKDSPRTLRLWADRARMLAGSLDIEALKMVEAVLEEKLGSAKR